MEENKEIIENKPLEDDGTLAFLNIPSDASRRQFNCPEVTQQKLVNTTFWVIDYYDEIKTKYGLRTLVKIKDDPKDGDSNARKFFTNCEDIKYILGQIRERDAFPRKVTMRANGNHYFLE